tara:strand:+ start:1499 stop:1654 length:156 start_codon:yes stop_codon:yes gene_type:complete
MLSPQLLATSAFQTEISHNQAMNVFAGTNFQIIKGLIAVAMTDFSTPSIRL